jgi:hypothetical protein
MSHAIIRGKSGRRHEVDFIDEPIRVEVHASEETVEIVVETDEHLPEHRRRFALLNIPRQLFSQDQPAPDRRPYADERHLHGDDVRVRSGFQGLGLGHVSPFSWQETPAMIPRRSRFA